MGITEVRRNRHLRGYDIGTEEVRSAILVSLLGSAGASTLKKAGVEAAGGRPDRRHHRRHRLPDDRHLRAAHLRRAAA
ncbi:MAG TPA: hypothetical protein VNO83_11650 [Pseudonocardia sp.]|nr:hypothetical protein [Pseudonocardia sp.]